MLSRRWATITALAASAAAVVTTTLLAGCGSGAGRNSYLSIVSTPTPSPSVPVNSFIRLLNVIGNQGVVSPTTLNGTAIPEACSGAAPIITAASNPAQVVRGGSFTVFVNTPAQVDSILVGAVGYPAYLAADLNAGAATGLAARSVSACCSANAPKHPMRNVTAGQTIGTRQVRQTGVEYQAVISIPSDIPASVTSFTLTLATVKNGVQSCIATLPVQIVASGQSSSRLQVSLSWSAPVDIDLHVTTPAGEEIFWDNTSDSTGGELDTDSNSSCNIDNRDQENISWRNTAPPSGTYKISPELYSNCSQSGPFPYVVTINNNGVQSIVRGTFNTNDDNSGVDKSFTIQVGQPN